MNHPEAQLQKKTHLKSTRLACSSAFTTQKSVPASVLGRETRLWQLLQVKNIALPARVEMRAETRRRPTSSMQSK